VDRGKEKDKNFKEKKAAGAEGKKRTGNQGKLSSLVPGLKNERRGRGGMK